MIYVAKQPKIVRVLLVSCKTVAAGTLSSCIALAPAHCPPHFICSKEQGCNALEAPIHLKNSYKQQEHKANTSLPQLQSNVPYTLKE